MPVLPGRRRGLICGHELGDAIVGDRKPSGVNKHLGKLGLTLIDAGLTGLLLLVVGCQSASPSPKVIFLDGAGHFGAGYSVRRGLERAGYLGSFETFSWSSWLGPGADHLVVARSKGKAHQLSAKIAEARRDFPRGKIYLMGLSAGTALILSALEDLPRGVNVDGVVLFSSSVSSRKDLTRALRHVNGRLYATCSPHDGILSAVAINADGSTGPAAGSVGFMPPSGYDREGMTLYGKVVNVPWRPSYLGFGWRGGHVEATTSGFVQHVIAPRLLSAEPYPLDQPVGGEPSQPSGQRRGSASQTIAVR